LLCKDDTLIEEYESESDDSIHTIQSLQSLYRLSRDKSDYDSEDENKENYDTTNPLPVGLDLTNMHALLADDNDSLYQSSDEDASSFTKVSNIRKSEPLKYYSKFMEDMDFDPRQHRWSATPPGYGESTRFGSAIKDWFTENTVPEDVYFPAPEPPLAKVIPPPRERVKPKKMSTIVETHDVPSEHVEVKSVKRDTRSVIPRTEKSVLGPIDGVINIDTLPATRKEKSAVGEKATPNTHHYTLSKNNPVNIGPDVSHFSSIGRAKGSRIQKSAASRIASISMDPTAPHHENVTKFGVQDVQPSNNTSVPPANTIVAHEIANVSPRVKRYARFTADGKVQRSGVVVDSHSPYATVEPKSDTHTSVAVSETTRSPVQDVAPPISTDPLGPSIAPVSEYDTYGNIDLKGDSTSTEEEYNDSGDYNKGYTSNSSPPGPSRPSNPSGPSNPNAPPPQNPDPPSRIQAYVADATRQSALRNPKDRIQWYYIAICPERNHGKPGHRNCKDCAPKEGGEAYYAVQMKEHNDDLAILRMSTMDAKQPEHIARGYGDIKFVKRKGTSQPNLPGATTYVCGNYWSRGGVLTDHTTQFERVKGMPGFLFEFTSAGNKYRWKSDDIKRTEFYCHRPSYSDTFEDVGPEKKQVVAFLGKKGEWCTTKKTKWFNKITVHRKKGKGWVLGIRENSLMPPRTCHSLDHPPAMIPDDDSVEKCVVLEDFLVSVACLLVNRKVEKNGFETWIESRRFLRIGWAGYTDDANGLLAPTFMLTNYDGGPNTGPVRGGPGQAGPSQARQSEGGTSQRQPSQEGPSPPSGSSKGAEASQGTDSSLEGEAAEEAEASMTKGKGKEVARR
jgi:hypothetical protein